MSSHLPTLLLFVDISAKKHWRVLDVPCINLSHFLLFIWGMLRLTSLTNNNYYYCFFLLRWKLIFLLAKLVFCTFVCLNNNY